MIKFESSDFKDELYNELQYVEKTFGSLDMLLDYYNIPIKLEEWIIDKDDYEKCFDEDTIIDKHTSITLMLDKCSDFDLFADITLGDFLHIINLFKSVTVFDNYKCIYKDEAVFRVNSLDEYTLYENFSDYNGFNNSILKTNSTYNDKKFECSLVRGITIFGMKILENKNYNEYFPPVITNDYFIKIKGSNFTVNELNNIANSYIFELSASNIINLRIENRPEIIDDDELRDITEYTNYIRPLIFGKGIDSIIEIYNKGIASDDIDRKIIEFVKVIEFASQTILRLEKTEIIQCKLNSTRALKADADYIRELEESFDEIKTKYAKDSDYIKLAINRCCDIQEICEIAPTYLQKVKNLKKNLKKRNSNKSELIESAKNELAQGISDTRNEISHAKPNYSLKGKECPEDEKINFVEMLRVIAVQVIKWYYNIHENQRVTTSGIE